MIISSLFADVIHNKVSIEAIHSPEIQDHNTFDAPHKVGIKMFTEYYIKKDQLQLEIPAHSVLLVKIEAN